MRPTLLFLLTACAEKTNPATCDASGVESGTADATVDGEEWSAAAATWTLAGSSLQLNTEPAGGWRMSLVAQDTSDGASAEDALAAASFPIAFTVKTGEEGGFATFYPTDGSSFVTNNAEGGELTVSGMDGDELMGCFAFEAATDEGDVVTIEAGEIRAVPLDI